MGSFCTSKPQITNTSQTQTYTPNPAVAQAGTQAIGMAENAASQPFQTPAAPVAPFNPFQTQAFDQYKGIQGGTNPFFQNASADMTRGEAPVTGADTASYMNPFSQDALANLKKYIFDPQRVSTMGQATQAAGGVGADRLALTSQNLDKTQSDALNQAESGFYGQALSAAQEAKARALQSAQGWANLGVGQQGAKLQATGALAGAGAQQQAQSQAELMSPYEQTLARIAYPYQQSQFLAGITGGLSGALGGTTQGQGTQITQPSQPSLFNQIAGLGMAGLGAYGAFGGFGGGSGGYATSTPNSPGASMYIGNPIYAGFGPTYAEGGSVEPWDLGQGYAPGGDVQEYSPDEFNPIDAAAPPAMDFNSMYGDRVASAGPFQPGSMRSMSQPPPAPAPKPQGPWDATPVAWPQGVGPPPRMMPSSQRTPLPLSPPSGINSDMKVSDFQQPRSQQPYPDALSRDSGQSATRSPWMALVEAGLRTAQSTKSGAAGLAEGLESGTKTLENQRKELRSEQQINQKADELYRHAKSELDKYTRKTPHQLATEQESTRYHNILEGLGKDKLSAAMQAGNLVYAGPVKDEPGMGYFYDKKHLDASGNPAVFKAPFDPGEKPGTAVRSGRIAAHELYKKLYPDDQRGAQDILLGHKTLTKDDVRKRIESNVTNAMKAQAIQPGTQEWLAEHKRLSDELMTKYQQEYGL